MKYMQTKISYSSEKDDFSNPTTKGTIAEKSFCNRVPSYQVAQKLMLSTAALLSIKTAMKFHKAKYAALKLSRIQ